MAARLTDPTSRARLLTAFTTDADSRLAAELAENASVAPAVVTIRATIQCGQESPAIGAIGKSNWIFT